MKQNGSDTDFGSSPDEGDLLALYVAGVASPSEREAVEALLQKSEDARAECERLKLMWERSGRALHSSVSREEVERGWARLVAEMDSDPAATSHTELSATRAKVLTGGNGRLVPPSSGRAGWRRAVLAMVLVVAGSVGLLELVRSRESTSRAGATVPREFVTRAGERLEVTLEDGSRVALAPESRLLVPEPRDEEARGVQLEGRAYFDVVPDASRPFVVTGREAVTLVLGTEFEVQSYPGEETAVTVRSGSVRVTPRDASREMARVLQPGSRGHVRAGTVEVEMGVDVEALLDWTHGTLSFRNTSLDQVVPELERWFDLEIHVEEATLNERRLTATFAGEPVDVVLATVAELTGASVHREGRQVLISSTRPG